jgi:hypothetical protein
MILDLTRCLNALLIHFPVDPMCLSPRIMLLIGLTNPEVTSAVIVRSRETHDLGIHVSLESPVILGISESLGKFVSLGTNGIHEPSILLAQTVLATSLTDEHKNTVGNPLGLMDQDVVANMNGNGLGMLRAAEATIMVV